MKINLQINKKDDKNEQTGILMCLLGIVEGPGVIRPTRVHPVNGTGFYVVHFGLLSSIRFLS